MNSSDDAIVSKTLGGTISAWNRGAQQFGTTQTDVFLVDESKQSSFISIATGVPRQGPKTIGSVGIAPGGAFLAASQQCGTFNRTDVFVVDENGQLNVFWVNASDPWQGPQKIGPPGSFIVASEQFGTKQGQTDVFPLDNNGQLKLFWFAGTGPGRSPARSDLQVWLTRYVPGSFPTKRCTRTNQTPPNQ